VGEMAEPYRSVGVGLAAAAGAALLLALGTLWVTLTRAPT